MQYTPSQYLSALLNVRSLSSNLLQIQHLLEHSSFDILVLTGTRTKQNQSLEVIQGTLSTMGYRLVAAHRPDMMGGVSLIHKDTIEVRKKDAGKSQTFEYLILELANRSIIAIIYCPQNSSISTFLDEFTDWISHLLNKYMDPLILGDLNINLREPGMPNSAAFLECLETYGLMQWVLDPTHQSASLLDHIITGEASTVLLDRPKVLDLISDHRLILFGIPKHQPLSKPTIVKFKKLNDIPTQVMQQEISDVFKLCQKTDDPNTYLEIANKTWLTALDRIAPEKESRKKDWKRLPWFNAKALALKQIKRQMEARYIKSHSEVDKKAYQDARNIYLLKLKRTKCLYSNTAVENTQGDQRKLFGLLYFLTKEQEGNLMSLACDASLAEGFTCFFVKKLKLYVNYSIL